MDFCESLNNRLINLIDAVDSTTLKKMTSGFYQLSKLYDIKTIDLNALVEKRKKIKDEILNFLIQTPSLEQYTKISEPSEEIAFFLIYMGKVYNDLMMLEKSLEFYQVALHQREQSLGHKHLFTAELYQKVGKLYEQGGAYTKALRYYKQVLWIRKEFSYVENNLLVAESYNNLAVLYYYMQEYAMAKRYIDKTVNIREKLLSSDDELLVNSYYNQKFIYKECQAKRDTVSLWFQSLLQGIAILFRRLVHKKEF